MGLLSNNLYSKESAYSCFKVLTKLTKVRIAIYLKYTNLVILKLYTYLSNTKCCGLHYEKKITKNIRPTVASRYNALDCVAHYQARTLHSTRYVMIISWLVST